jgi:hypothetical protein
MHWVVGKEYSEVVERKSKCRLHSMLPKETVPVSFFLKSTYFLGIGGEPFFLKSDQKSKTGVGGVLLILYDNMYV